MAFELHPFIVHFPVALTMVAAIYDVGRWIFDRERLLAAGFWGGSSPLLVMAFLGAIAAVASGLVAEPTETTPVVNELIEAHELLAFVASGLLAVLTFWRVGLRGTFPRKWGFLYLTLMVTVAVVIGFGSYFGGQMVFTHGVGVDTIN